MDSTQVSILEKLLLKLLEPSTTPEDALQLFSSPRFSLYSYKEEDNEPVLIFFAYIRFISMRLPDACVSGIWEDILRNTVLYSKNFSDSIRQSTSLRFNYSRHIFTSILPCDGLQFTTWLEEALSTPSKCPNPLIRLELFRFTRILREDLCDISWNRIWPTLKLTLTEIQPCHLYPSEDEDMLLFGIIDLRYIINQSLFGEMYINIPNCSTLKELVKNNQVFHKYTEIKFICHCIRLIGIFAKMAFTLSDHQLYSLHLSQCFNMLRHTLRKMLAFEEQLPRISLTWNQFRKIISLSPFRHYVVETIQDLTESIMNKNLRETPKLFALQIRNILAKDLGVWTNLCDLPKLLLSRQIQSPMIVHQHSLLLEYLCINQRSKLLEHSNNDVVFDRLVEILELINVPDIDSSDEAPSSGDSSNDSDY